MPTTVNNNSQSNFLPLLINGTPVAVPEDLVYNPASSSYIFPDLVSDLVSPIANYHGGNPLIDEGEIQFFDCSAVQISNDINSVVSDFRTKGITELRPLDGYYWDEVYTTPLGLFEHKPGGPIGFYDFYFSAPNEVKIRTEDANIIPKTDDYIIFQRFFDGQNSFTNESTTDDLNHVPVYNRAETFELKIITVVPSTGSVFNVSGVDNAGQIIITTTIGHGLSDGDRVDIVGVVGVPAANGAFLVDEISATEFKLLGLDGTTLITGTGVDETGGEVRVLPEYTLTLDKSFDPIGDGTVLAIDNVDAASPIGITTTTPHSYSTGTKVKTQGVTLNGGADTGDAVNANGVFFITVTGEDTFELDGTIGQTGYDSSTGTVLIEAAKYFVVLLNRQGTSLNVELIKDTWRKIEIHRKQLLGDSFEETSVLNFRGAKNYLNYSGHEFLGVQHLLKGIIETRQTPFVVFDIEDDVKDRLYNAEDVIEVHLPTIMLQGEATQAVLKNKLPVLTDDSGEGEYSGLYFSDAIDTDVQAIRFGWVLHELRLIVIDHPELATALGYNSNRNFTLPAPQLSNDNLVQNPIEGTPIFISNVTDGSPIQITTIGNHNFKNGETVTITSVLSANPEPAAIGTFVVANVAATTFEIYDRVTGLPIVGNGTYTSGGKVVGNKPAFEYFMTYRINGIHYDTLPYAEVVDFNFDVNDEIFFTIPSISHLVDSDIFEGFEANTFEVIVGKHEVSSTDPTIVTGIDFVVLSAATQHNGVLLTALDERVNLQLKDKDDVGKQFAQHTVIVNKNDFEDSDGVIKVTDLFGGPVTPYELIDTAYYDASVLPPTKPENATLFTGEGVWLHGFVKYKQEAKQYRMTANVVVPANRWNGTTNPSFEAGNTLMTEKLISEIAFLIRNENTDEVINPEGSVSQSPYVYAKISPPVRKNNQTDLNFEISLDF